MRLYFVAVVAVDRQASMTVGGMRCRGEGGILDTTTVDRPDERRDSTRFCLSSHAATRKNGMKYCRTERWMMFHCRRVRFIYCRTSDVLIPIPIPISGSIPIHLFHHGTVGFFGVACPSIMVKRNFRLSVRWKECISLSLSLHPTVC
jgi:hypothetical protein